MGGGRRGKDPRYLSAIMLGREKRVVRISPDGNCLFRCIAYAHHGDAEQHGAVRTEIADYLQQKGESFCYKKGLFDGDWTHELTSRYAGNASRSFEGYVDYISTLGTFGDTPCFRVFQMLHPEFVFTVWGEAPQSIVFTKRHGQMLR